MYVRFNRIRNKLIWCFPLTEKFNENLIWINLNLTLCINDGRSIRPSVHPMGIDIKAQLSSYFKCSRLQICSRFFVCVSVEKGRCPYSVICMQTTPMLEGDTRVIKTLSIFRTFSLSGRDENVSGVEWRSVSVGWCKQTSPSFEFYTDVNCNCHRHHHQCHPHPTVIDSHF